MKHTMLVAAGLFSLAVAAQAADTAPFKVKGVYTETCACGIPCKCELTGDVPSICQGVGAMRITAGSYGGQSLDGVGIAYALKPGEWVRVYIDAPDKARRDAAEKFARHAYAGFGPIEAVKEAKITVNGGAGAYTVSMSGDATMAYTIAPVLGGDKKTALTHGNTFNVFTPMFWQAKSTATVTFKDGDRSFELNSGRNGYFNDMMDRAGEI